MLRSDGRIGAHYVSPPGHARFIEVIAAEALPPAMELTLDVRAHAPVCLSACPPAHHGGMLRLRVGSSAQLTLAVLW